MPSPVLTAHRDAILALARQHGVSRVRVFGSVARGDDNRASDLDLLVDLQRGGSLLDLIALKQEIEGLIHRAVDIVTEGALSPHLRPRVLAEAVEL